MAYTQPQYAYRAQKSIGLVDGHPEYTPSSLITSDAQSAKTYKYAPTGQMFAYVVGSDIHVVPTSYSPSSTSKSTPKPFQLPRSIIISQAGVIDLAFSPTGRFLFTWERLGKVEDGVAVGKNLRMWWLGDVGSEGGEAVEAAGFTQKAYDQWQPLMTEDESHLLRMPSTSEISIFALQTPSSPLPPTSESQTHAELFGLDKPISRIRLEGTIRGLWLSPRPAAAAGLTGREGVGIWLGEHKGAPGTVALYYLSHLLEAGAGGKAGALPATTARKNFFKGDKVVLKWNAAGTMALFLCQSDVDNSGKSYYGETNLFLIALNGNFECKVQLDKEGPIYDFAWNPNSREFGAVYGFMPARTVLFDTKASPVHSFGPQPRNFLSYQPQGRLFLSAGFGNLTGTVDIFDLRTRKKLVEFRAPNSTSCEWSPCGRFILTGTLSPRLRVDNGMKVWWCTGGLMHMQSMEELYQVTWRPGPLSAFPDFPTEIPAPPTPSSSAAHLTPAENSPAPKPAGAYRPPGLRGSLTPSIFKREDEGGAPSAPPGANGFNQNNINPAFQANRNKGRHVPGAPPPGAEVNGNGHAGGQANGKGKKGKKSTGPNTPAGSGPGTPVVEQMQELAVDPEIEATQKKIRNLNKKLKAITDLKDKRTAGETLEATQIKKIDGEKAILQELAGLESSLKK